MANRNRVKKQLPIHMEHPPALPEDEDPTGGLWRLGMIKIDQKEYRPISDDSTVMDLLKMVLGVDHDITLRELRAMTEGKDLEPLPPALEAEINWREKRHQALMDDLRRGFEENGNPLFIWDAYQLCRKDKRHPPTWVEEYFDKTAWRMTDINNVPSDAAEYLGFRNKKAIGGGPQAWEQYASFIVRREAVSHVQNFLIEHPEETVPNACLHALPVIRERWPSHSNKVSEETIRKWYYSHI
jgi:hypothetical protein